mgnify:CR=1 FL=1
MMKTGFLVRLISGDLPRSRILAVLLVAAVLALAFAPFLFPGTKALGVASRILIFIVLAASAASSATFSAQNSEIVSKPMSS